MLCIQFLNQYNSYKICGFLKPKASYWSLLPYNTTYQNISKHHQKSNGLFGIIFQQLKQKFVLQAEIPPELNKSHSESRSLNKTHSYTPSPIRHFRSVYLLLLHDDNTKIAVFVYLRLVTRARGDNCEKYANL
jgi:hypothetical protein